MILGASWAMQAPWVCSWIAIPVIQDDMHQPWDGLAHLCLAFCPQWLSQASVQGSFCQVSQMRPVSPFGVGKQPNSLGQVNLPQWVLSYKLYKITKLTDLGRFIGLGQDKAKERAPALWSHRPRACSTVLIITGLE
jgi:hypothetical protein